MTKTQATGGGAAVKAGAAAARTGAAATARQGVYRARIWTAPRLDRTGRALEKQVAPRIAAMLSSASRRIDPAAPGRRRRPFVAGGLVLAAGLTAIAAYLLIRRGSRQNQWGKVTDTPVAAPPPSDPAAQPTPADVNGRLHTP